MTLLGQEDLGEVGHHGQFVTSPVRPHSQPGHRPIGHVPAATAGHEVAAEHALGDLGNREAGQCAAQVAAGVAAL